MAEVAHRPALDFGLAAPPTRRQRSSSYQAGPYHQSALLASPERIRTSRLEPPAHEVKRVSSAGSIREHVSLSPPKTYTSSALSCPPSPTRSPRRPPASPRSHTSPLINNVELPAVGTSSPSRSYTTPTHRRRQSTGDGVKPARLFLAEELARPSLSAEVERAAGSSQLAAPVFLADELDPDETPIPVHTRSRSIAGSVSAGAKTLARKASGKLRSLGSRREPASEQPPMPDAAEQEEARRLAPLTLSRSNSDHTGGKAKQLKSDSAQSSRAATPLFVNDDAMETLAGQDGGQELIAGPLLRGESPTSPALTTSSYNGSPKRGGNGGSPKRNGSSTSRKGSQSRLRSAKTMSRSESEGDLHRPSSRKSLRHRTSSPAFSFRNRSDRAIEEGDETASKKGLSRKKSSPSLLIAGSASFFHVGKHHEPPPTPLITPFLIDPCESPTAERIPLKIAVDPDWPPKRGSSRNATETYEETAEPAEPTLLSSLATLSKLADPGVPEGAEDRPRIRFPAAFGFVPRPGEELDPESDLPDILRSKSPPPRSTNTSPVPVPTAPTKPPRLGKLDFEDLLAGDDQVVIKKSLTPSITTHKN